MLSASRGASDPPNMSEVSMLAGLSRHSRRARTQSGRSHVVSRLALALLVLASILPAGPLAVAQEASSDPAPQIADELVEKRGERSKVFLNSDGSHTARLFTSPVHFLAQDGTWQEIDPTLVASELSGYAWRNAADSFAVHFSATAKPQDMVLVTDSTSSVSFGFEGADPASAAVVDGSKITYPGIRPGMDLVYEVREGEVKELVVLHNAPEQQLDLRFPLTLSNLTAQETTNDAFNLVTSSGEVGFYLSDLWMIDSALDPSSGESAFSENVVATLSDASSTPTLTVTPDHAWLTAPERIYPVTIDPTITKETNDDTYIQSNICCKDVSGELEMKSGTYDSGSTKARSLLKFADVQSQIPSGATITGARMHVWESHSWSCTPRDVSAHRITDSWDGNSVRWSTQPGVASAATTVNVAKGYSSSCGAGWVEFPNLGDMVTYWKNNNNNYGIEIRSPNETNNDWWKKWHATGSGHRPYLEVFYSDPDTTPPPPPSISSSTHPSQSTWYANDDPSFSFSSTDASGIGGYSYVLDQNSGTEPDKIIETTGTTASFTNKSEGQWWFHVRAKDGAPDPNWGDPSHFKIQIDISAPGAPSLSSSTHGSTTTCSTNNDPAFSWSASDLSGISGYSYLLDRSSSTTPDTTSEGTGTTRSYTDIADGDWWFHVRAQNGSGLWGSASHYKVQINAAPADAPATQSGTHPSQSTWYANDDPAVSWSLTDFFGITGYSRALDQSSTTTPDTLSEGTATSSGFADLADGEWWFHVRGQDGCGVWGNTGRYRFRIDDTNPAAPSISSSSHSSESTWYSNNDPAFQWSVSDTSGISGHSFVIDRGTGVTVDTTSDSTSAGKSYVDLADGVWYFHARSQNGSGLWGLSSYRKVQIDTVVPGAPSLSSSTHPDQTLTYRSNDPSFEWKTPSDMSGISGYSYVLDQVSGTTPDTTSEGTSLSKSYSNLADGTYYFHVRAKDAAGNWGGASQHKVTINVPAPAVSPRLSAPEGQIDPDGKPVVKNGDLLTFGGDITEGTGADAPLDTTAKITTCDLVVLNEAGATASRLAVPLTSCRNVDGKLTGSYSPSSLGVTRGSVRLEVVAERTEGGVTKTSGVQQSSPVMIDNKPPVITAAELGCDSEFPGVCEDETTIRVLLSEKVKGDFLLADFTVSGNTILSAESGCTTTTFCNRVTLVVATELSGDNPPTVTYAHVSLPGRVRPHDGPRQPLPDGSHTLRDPIAQPDSAPLDSEPDPDDPPAELRVSPPGQVLVLSANVLQSLTHRDGYVDDCGAVGAGADKDCNAEGRELAFARRIKKLAEKSQGLTDQSVDGMDMVPDILLLQETRCDDARGIAKELRRRIRVGGAVPEIKVAACREEPKYEGDDGNPEGPVLNDTAVLYNESELELIRVRTVLTAYDSSQNPEDCDDPTRNFFIDGDGDGQNDCIVKWKRHYRALFEEVKSGKKVAVASVHLTTSTHNSKQARPVLLRQWMTKIANHLQRFDASSYVIAGDLNAQRCVDTTGDEVTEPGEVVEALNSPEPQGCTPTAWWGSLTGPGYDYLDSVFDEHGDLRKRNTQRDLDRQYFKGCSSDLFYDEVTKNCTQYGGENKRIDFVFAKGPVADPVLGASFDINCGVDDPPSPGFQPHCRSRPPEAWGNPRRYSDHRLLWGLVAIEG